MATIDVDELLDDPDFEDDFVINRAVEMVGSDGRANFMTMQIICTGVIQPASGRSLELIPDGARVQGAMEIWTRSRLRMNDGYYAADTVRWEDRNYIVSNVQDFLNYGKGYVRAVCTLQDLTGPDVRRNETDE